MATVRGNTNDQGGSQNVLNGMPYVEFQTQMLKILDRVSKQQLSVRSAFRELVTSPELFADQPQGGLLLIWPYHDSQRQIQVMANVSQESDSVSLEFSYQGERFLTLSWHQDSEIIARIHTLRGREWTNIDISDLVDNFNEVIRAKRIVYVSKRKRDEAMVDVLKNDIHSFSKEEFDEFMLHYSENNLTARINNVIVNNAAKRANNYTFKLQWPDSLGHSHQLKVAFSRADRFLERYSWFVNEQTLLNMFPDYDRDELKTGQYYYSLKVTEVCDDDDSAAPMEAEVLSLWLTLDGLFGELRDVKKGMHLSGNDVLNIYKYFDQLFQVKNTFICDASSLLAEDDTVRIPLRLISALASGKTWYEYRLPGVQLFECSQFQTVANGVINQNRERRRTALLELQNLPLSDWYAMLSPSGKIALRDIYQGGKKISAILPRRSSRLFEKHRQSNVDFGAMTIQELTANIYNEAKQLKTVTPKLGALVNLLCEGICLDEDRNHRLDTNAPDIWIKSRVRELLWGSFFWVKENIVSEQRKVL